MITPPVKKDCGITHCSVHTLDGRTALPCAEGEPAYAIPATEYGQSLSQVVSAFEAFLITDALRRTKGVLREAAMLLGMTRGGLNQILQSRQRALQHLVVWERRGAKKSVTAAPPP